MRLPYFCLVLTALVLPSCGSANRLLKVSSAELTPFFEQPELAQDARRQYGFQKVWVTPDRQVLQESLNKKKLYIAPVSLAYLRPVNKALVGRQTASNNRKRHEQGAATRLHAEFTRAFQASPAPLYQLVDKPANDALVLQLALTELKPTSAQGNVITTVLKLVITPLAAVGGFFTKGNIAIEGKMLVPMPGKGRQHRAFFQFADKERDKLTLFSLRDYQSYGHAEHTIRDWARRFEQMTRARKGEKVSDSSAMTLSLY